MGDHLLVRPEGEPCLHTVVRLRSLLDKPLLDHGRVVLDVSRLVLRWSPAVHVLTMALAAAGGWPTARLVLVAAEPDMAAALHAARVPLSVPLGRIEDVAALLQARPARVAARHELPCALEAPGCARALLAMKRDEWAGGEMRGEVWDDAARVVTELVSNAVVHARTASVLTIALDQRGLHVAIRDDNPRGAECFPVGSSRKGRGLLVVDALSAHWGITPHPDGKTVWAVLDTKIGPPA